LETSRRQLPKMRRIGIALSIPLSYGVGLSAPVQ
jgi:hypothetical protein